MSIATHPDFAEGAYDELSFWSSRFGALLFDNLELRTNIQGLDVACGTGFPLIELAHAHGPSSHFTGLDPWAPALTRARRKLNVFGITNVALVEGDAHEMTFADESFDLITSNLGINNFDDPPKAMKECHRVARKNARIAVTTNLKGHMAAFYDLFRASVPSTLVDAVNAQEAHRGTRESIEALITDAGFTLRNVVESEFHLHFADGTAMLRHPLIGFFKDGWMGVTSDERVWRELEEKLNAGAKPLRFRIPMLYAEGVKT
ncbi:MAG TPA: methyltransferase domain-containing protein [Thermoanaerobaculia bacterium]|nr:methyltransferase domain-containing protein [Thermoanaerobaculia bacterium]